MKVFSLVIGGGGERVMLISVSYHVKQGQLLASGEVYLVASGEVHLVAPEEVCWVASTEDCLSFKEGHSFHFANVGHCHFVENV